MTRAAIAIVAIVAGLAVEAAAEPRLVLDHEPPPRHLRMRPRAATATPRAAPVAAPTVPRATPPAEPPATSSADLEGLRDVHEPVSFSLTVGYQVDGTRRTSDPTLAGKQPVVDQDFQAVRSYAFGDGFVSTHGVVAQSLSTYLAVRFEAARRLDYRIPNTDTIVPVTPPIATWFERSGAEVRTGWAEIKDFLPSRWSRYLERLRVRAGDQYVYGPWVLHMDGTLIAYDGKIVTASAYTGLRHADYARDQPAERAAVAGASARFDLRGLPSPVPIAIAGEYLLLGSVSTNDQPQAESTQIEADWRPRRDIAVIGQVRALNRVMANQRLEVRTRYKQVTNFVFDVTHRLDADWRWDPSLIVPDTDPTQARRYLDLGPVLPQLTSSFRGGTLIAENVDLFARAAIAADLSSSMQTKNSFSPTYFELGGAVEVRPRRTVALGASVLSRTSRRQDLGPLGIQDQHLLPQPLPPNAATGEASFVEIGTSLRMALGARRFSTVLEIYGRRTHYAEIYRDLADPVPTHDIRGGGRITVDAWIAQRVRLFAAYDVSSAFDFAPEITGYKSLRLMMTGVY